MAVVVLPTPPFWLRKATIIGGLAIFAMRAMLSPFRVLIQNNTDALNRITDKLDYHDERLGNHEGRIVKIETVHEIEDKE